MPEIRISDNPRRVLGSSNVPYAKMITWDGRYRDYYLVDLSSGEKRRALENHAHSVSLSPDGKYLVYFADGEWCMMESATMKTRNLTAGMEVDPEVGVSVRFPA